MRSRLPLFYNSLNTCHQDLLTDVNSHEENAADDVDGNHKVEIGAPRNHGYREGAHHDHKRPHPHPVISTCMTQNL